MNGQNNLAYRMRPQTLEEYVGQEQLAAKEAVYQFPNEPIPLHLRNAPTKLMKNLGYGKEYKWSEDYVGHRDKRSFLPEKLRGKKFYES